MINKIRKRANIEALINSKLGLRKFASNLIQNQDQKNMLLALRVHDEICQSLAALKIEIGLIQKEIGHSNTEFKSESLKKNLAGALINIEQTLQKSVEISASVWPELLDILGLIPAVNQMSLKFIKQNGVACQFITSIDTIELDKKMAIAVYQITNEALKNIALHAQATDVTIALDKVGEKYQLRIIDNGIGFNTRVNNETKWYGFIEMMQRAADINAELNIYSLKNKGTELVLSFKG